MRVQPQQVGGTGHAGLLGHRACGRAVLAEPHGRRRRRQHECAGQGRWHADLHCRRRRKKDEEEEEKKKKKERKKKKKKKKKMMMTTMTMMKI